LKTLFHVYLVRRSATKEDP